MRYLSSYLPENYDPAEDCTPFVRRALAEGIGTLYLDAGIYRFSDVTVPDNTILRGAGPDTIIRPAAGKTVFCQHTQSNWAIRDLTIEGDNNGNISGDAGFKAIEIDNCWGYDIASVVICKCNGIGIDISHTPLGKEFAAFCNGGNLSRLTLFDNFIGIRFDCRAEYISAVQLNVYNNETGCVIHSGNIKIATSNFCENIDGILIEDKENGSHGSISNCLVNHNQRYAVRAFQVRAGMAIVGCCFYYGKIKLTDCAGINISSGQISCDVQIAGTGVNQLVNNFIIPEAGKFMFSESTLLTGNFFKSGIWEK